MPDEPQTGETTDTSGETGESSVTTPDLSSPAIQQALRRMVQDATAELQRDKVKLTEQVEKIIGEKREATARAAELAERAEAAKAGHDPDEFAKAVEAKAQAKHQDWVKAETARIESLEKKLARESEARKAAESHLALRESEVALWQSAIPSDAWPFVQGRPYGMLVEAFHEHRAVLDDELQPGKKVERFKGPAGEFITGNGPGNYATRREIFNRLRQGDDLFGEQLTYAFRDNGQGPDLKTDRTSMVTSQKWEKLTSREKAKISNERPAEAKKMIEDWRSRGCPQTLAA